LPSHYEEAAVPIAAVAIAIPIVSIVMGICIGMLALYLDYRKKIDTLKLYHAERMAAIERGLELPPLPEAFFGSRTSLELQLARSRKTGLILLFIGLSIAGAMYGMDIAAFWWGFVPASLGLALLISSLLEMREHQKRRISSP